MNPQQVLSSRTSANGIGRRKGDKDIGGRTESKMHYAKSASNHFRNAGLLNGEKVGGSVSPSRDRLIYVMTSLIGHHVEVHVKNGSVISGIFHAANVDQDIGVILKMAQLTKDGIFRGPKPVSDIVERPQIMIIPARELVQIFAKGISLSTDKSTNGHTSDRCKDLMIDSVISHSHHVEERELGHWAPDEGDSECPELENIFDGTWNRNWDQFQTNETLFGVKSTFNEELYTTKLERGPRMRDLEREASRIAREIEGEETEDLHLAEERGIYFDEEFDLDEEIRYSAVCRDVDGSRFQENEKSDTDSWNIETLGASVGSIVTSSNFDSFSRKANTEALELSICSSVDEEACSHLPADKNEFPNDSVDHVSQLTSDYIATKSLSMDESRLNEKEIKGHGRETCVMKTLEESKPLIVEEKPQLTTLKGSYPGAIAHDPSTCSQGKKHSINESSYSAISSNLSPATEPVNSYLRPGSSTSTSERVCASSVPAGTALSPSSSMGSLSSERSMLNPNAKEFKLNPNAKSFTPSASLRPQSPVSDGSFYYTSNVSASQHMPGLPVGIGGGPSFGGGHQPVIYNPQAAQLQSPQSYIPPNGPLYNVQQMIIGQTRPVYYMPTYPPELPYRGRNFQ
ncbi:polyadenylate-binding protein-interacting protein 4-like [Typha latifolia]|uniref:polyadenylate-binding protein-interacting protein 4-like n=1 Tax=Typha latifolia TaxID=4733 RepID=UPI003C2D7B3F